MRIKWGQGKDNYGLSEFLTLLVEARFIRGGGSDYAESFTPCPACLITDIHDETGERMHNPIDTKVPVTRDERIKAFKEMRDRIDVRLQELEGRGR